MFNSQQFLHSSIITSGPWLIRENMAYLFEESHCSPALLKVPIYSTELVTVYFVWKTLC